MTESTKCPAKAAGYDDWFGISCDLPEGHDGLHNDGEVEWRFVDPDDEPARAAELFRQEQEARRRRYLSDASVPSDGEST